MARHPWVAEADRGVRWGLQTVVPNDRAALPRLLKTAKRVEELGFDSLFVMDHPATHAEPYVTLSGIAAVTRRLWLGQLVMAAAYRHPAYVARLQADLDNLCGGRSILGVGSGWFKAEYEMMNIPFPGIAQRQKSLDEAITILDGVWGDAPFSYEGEYFQVRGMQIEPPPARRPPVLVGGSGEKTTLRQVAQWGDACNLREDVPNEAPPSQDAERFAAVAHKFKVLQQHCLDLGRPLQDVLKTHFTQYLVMGATQREAENRADEVDTARSTSAGVKSTGRPFMMAASPERAFNYYRGLRDAGAQYFVVQVGADDLETIETLSQLIGEV